jgi:carboxyl-terminal processing protease
VPVVAPPTAPQALPPTRKLLDEVVARIRREYVEPVSDAAIERAAVKGVIASLDPHSAFLSAAEYEQMRQETSGSYSGLGIEVSAQDGRIVIVAPIAESPAARAGIHAGDVILAIDDHPVVGEELEASLAMMRGQPGTRVRLAVSRKGEAQPLMFELERSEVHVHTVRSAPLPGGIGYVRITEFSDSTAADLDAALVALEGSRPTALRGLILDLRGNPGGVLESAVEVADEFLDDGLIVRADGRTPDARFAMNATAGDALGGAPVVILLDGGSASGSEIVAGALRDHRRATLMGQRTFGKGSVQTVMPLQDGQALKLTTSHYFTPSGASIHGLGLEPDVTLRAADSDGPLVDLARPVNQDPAVRKALQYLRDRSLGTQYAQAGAH